MRQPDGTWTGLPYAGTPTAGRTLQRSGAPASASKLIGGGGANEKFAYGVPTRRPARGATRPRLPAAGHPAHRGRGAQHEQVVRHRPPREPARGAGRPEAAVGLHRHRHGTGQRRLARPLRKTLEARAKAYLDSNCAHCHNPGSNASQSDLMLEPRPSATYAVEVGRLQRSRWPTAARAGAPYRLRHRAGPGRRVAAAVPHAATATAEAMLPRSGATEPPGQMR